MHLSVAFTLAFPLLWSYVDGSARGFGTRAQLKVITPDLFINRPWFGDFEEGWVKVHGVHPTNNSRFSEGLLDALSVQLLLLADPDMWHLLGVEYRGEPFSAIWRNLSFIGGDNERQEDLEKSVLEHIQLAPIQCREITYYEELRNHKVPRWCDATVVFNFSDGMKLNYQQFKDITNENVDIALNPLPTDIKRRLLTWNSEFSGECDGCLREWEEFHVVDPWSRCYPRNYSDTQCTGDGLMPIFPGTPWPMATEAEVTDHIDDEDEPTQPLFITEPEDFNLIPIVGAIGGVLLLGAGVAAWWFGLLQRKKEEEEELVGLEDQHELNVVFHDREMHVDTAQDDWA